MQQWFGAPVAGTGAGLQFAQEASFFLAFNYPSFPPSAILLCSSPSYPLKWGSTVATAHWLLMASFTQAHVLLVGFLAPRRLSMTNGMEELFPSLVSEISPCASYPPELSNCHSMACWTLHDQLEGFINCSVLRYGTRACLQLAQENNSRHMYLVQQMLFVCWVIMSF